MVSKNGKVNKNRVLNVTVVFSEDEEANQIAFENAVRAILFADQKKENSL